VRRLLPLLAVLLAGCPGLEPAFDTDGDGEPDWTDCGPGDPDVFPGAPDPIDGVDQDCDGADGVDADGDGHASLESGGDDCNDADPSIHPDATEIPEDDADQDCDGVDLVCDEDGDSWLAPACGGQDCDDDEPACNADCSDADGDGVRACAGDCDDGSAACVVGCEDDDGDGHRVCDGDCRDDRDDVHPAAEEACDGLDTDCDGDVPADEADGDGDGAPGCDDCDDADPTASPLDGDGDGFDTCADPPDCDDALPGTHPGAPDGLGDDADTNCDGVDGVDADGDGVPLLVDCDDDDATCQADCDDADGDGYRGCDGDCDDTNAAVSPGAPELCNGVDDDCDGALPADEADGDLDGDPACSDCDDVEAGANTLDGDGDGVTTCDDDPDCDDAAYTTFPGAPDGWGDEVDSNCDGLDGVDADGDDWASVFDCDDSDPALNLDDADGDGAHTCAGDCDDADPVANPFDVDGDGVTSCAGDCDDGNAAVGPGFPEICDDLDDDCDGAPSGDEIDDDGDGWTECDDDCDDGAADVFPGNWVDPPGDGLDSNCDGFDHWDLSASDVILHGTAYDEAGTAVAGGGDVDGDGVPDLIVGAPYDGSVGHRCGHAYVVSGSSLLPGGAVPLSSSLASLPAEAGCSTDWAGSAVSWLGDLDGDGLDDVLVGALSRWEAGVTGKAYLLLSTGLLAGDHTDLGSAEATFLAGAYSDAYGASLANVGDLDGDGVPDLAISATGSDAGGTNSGATDVWSGATVSGGGAFGLGDAEIAIDGAEEEWSGVVSAGCDIDGDGSPEVLVGASWDAPSRLYVFSGAGLAFGDELTTADAWLVLEDPEETWFGGPVSCDGDVDGDGLADLLVGAPKRNPGSGSWTGGAYLFFGASVAAGGTITVADADHSWIGMADDHQFGWSVAIVGDLDRDGLDDLAVGAPQVVWNGVDSGAAFVFLASSLPATPDAPALSADFVFVGPGFDALAGAVVGTPGDLDGDGASDLLVGVPGGSITREGEVVILLSPF
jgi:hypothetical protein